MELKKDYYLLLVDVVSSTELPSEVISKKMNKLDIELVKINKKYKKQLELPLSISYGDEVAGLFRNPAGLYEIITTIRAFFYPLTTVRFAVVKGRVAVVSDDIRKIGGAVFKKASRAISTLKLENKYSYWNLGKPLRDKCLISLSEVSNAIVINMSEYQRSVYELLATGLSQKEIAVQLGKYTQSVWDAVQRSQAEPVIEAEKTINLILAEGSW